MANLISYASGNITGATTFKGAETGTGAAQTTKSSSTNSTTSYVYSSAFTVTNLDVIEGVLLFVEQNNSTTGTFNVALSDDNGTTATRELQVNVADLPADPSWVFFKFGSTLTGDGGSDYKVGIKSSTNATVTVYRDGTAGNWARLLMTNAAATAAANDNMYVVGNLTGAGTGNDFTVTMDQTAATDYGTVDIGKRGTLQYGTTAATNYVLRLSGNLNIWDDATLNIGTTGTPIPRDSTAVLEFDCAADGDFGLIANNGSTFNAQGLSRTSGKNITWCLLNTDEAANSTSLGVDTDTGWLDNDVICIASTTRTATQHETGALNGNAGASSLTVDGFAGTGGGVLNAHLGTSPIQAEVGLLTRNVKIRSTLSTAMTYVTVTGVASVDIDWIEFRYIGVTAGSPKRGLDLQHSTGTVSVSYCSFYDCEGYAVAVANTGASTNTIEYSVFYNCANVANSAMLLGSSTGTNTIDNNVFIGGTTSSGQVGAIQFTALGSSHTVSNNRIQIGSTNVNSGGMIFTSTVSAWAAFSGNVIHSCPGQGIAADSGIVGTAITRLTISNLTVYRCGGAAWRSSSNSQGFYGYNLTFDSCNFFGNTTSNFSLGLNNNNHYLNWIFKSCNFHGDTSFATTNGIVFPTSGATNNMIVGMVIDSCDFGTASGIKTTHTNDINLNVAGSFVQINMRNTKLASGTEVANPTSLALDAYIKSTKHDQTAGNHKSWFRYGIISSDATTYKTAAPSMKMTPNNASNKLESFSFYAPVANGNTITPTVNVNEDGSYNGNRARLIVKANPAIGITTDTVLDTATAASDGAWEALTGTTIAATDDGVMEFVVDCDGTAGNLYVDDFSTGGAVDSKQFQYWFNGGPLVFQDNVGASNAGLLVHPGMQGGMRG